MLVAASVTLNQTGTARKKRPPCHCFSPESHLVLRVTTLMPHIRGLPALTIMSFTPVLELRTHGTCYTGAVCGLGLRNGTERIYPDHHIELAFDTTFTAQDMAEMEMDQRNEKS
ncbi:hypothetical protein WMY93_032925 [Mugilogobius chulae]|uniref:Uncharacterized protein n=1 Tax=Mugilogobius chulae TaxID=88201 RepID=A0AAW0MIC5_9GOBI